jgi:hypothetical protein
MHQYFMPQFNPRRLGESNESDTKTNGPNLKETNISAGIMKRPWYAVSPGIAKSAVYILAPVLAVNYFFSNDNQITRAIEKTLVYSTMAGITAAIFIGWGRLVDASQKSTDKWYEECFRNGRYPTSGLPGSDEVSDFERWCSRKYGRRPRLGGEQNNSTDMNEFYKQLKKIIKN